MKFITLSILSLQSDMLLYSSLQYVAALGNYFSVQCLWLVSAMTVLVLLIYLCCLYNRNQA